MRAVKMRAVDSDRRLKDVVADLLRRGLSQEADSLRAGPQRVELPLVSCAQLAAPDKEMTPERVAHALSDEEAESSSSYTSR